MQKQTEKFLQPFRKRFPRLAAYLKRRRVTILSLIISIAVLILLSLSLRGTFIIDTSTMMVRILPPKGVKVKEGHVRLHKGIENDELTIQFQFSATNPPEAGKIGIRLPKEFKLSESIALDGLKFVETWVRHNNRNYTYSLIGSDSPSLFLKFNGSVFRTRARELFFALSVDTNSYDNPPIRVTLTGLDRSDISYLTPQPQFRTAYAIDYRPLERESSAIPRLKIINFHMRDRERGYITDFRIFLTGIFLGVFASLFASILWDIIREYEIRAVNKT